MHALLQEYSTPSSRVAPTTLFERTATQREKAPLKPIVVSARDTERVFVVPEEELSLRGRLFDATAQAKIWTSRVAMHLDPASRTRFFTQIDRLHDADEWVGNDATLNLGSYKSFIRSVLYLKIDSRPSLALMPNGNLLAMWQCGGDRMSIEFYPGDRARWLVARTVADEIERAAGETSLLRLRAVLAPYDGDRWFHGG